MTASERFLPSLLDRLTDSDPDCRTEGPEQRAVSAATLRESVRRELSLLLNATHLAAVADLSSLPEVMDSTLNYGIADLAGRTPMTIDRFALARALRRAIVTFEPRLSKRSVKVDVTAQDGHDRTAVRIDIEGDLWGAPVPVRLRWRADLNLEDGEVAVAERA